MRLVCRHLPAVLRRRTVTVAVGIAAALAPFVALAPGTASAAPAARSCRTVAGTHSCIRASIGLSKSRLTAVGGLVTIHYAAPGATRCWLRATPAFWRGHNPARVRCGGTSRIKVTPSHTHRAWAFTFTATNRFGTTVRVGRTLLATAPPSKPLVTPYNSENWSGYAIEGGAFTGVQGSFTVPTITGATGQSDASEWVGVDGVSNQSLIQAGVHESDTNGIVHTYAWWEVLPAAETPIDPSLFPVAPGDTVTVQLQKLASHWWRITLRDGTNTYTTVRWYTGPMTSSEWIVEAPSYGSQIATLGNFATTPVQVTNMAVNGVQMAFDRIYMVLLNPNYSIKNTVSSPSDLLPSGFSVTYTPPAGP